MISIWLQQDLQTPLPAGNSKRGHRLAVPRNTIGVSDVSEFHVSTGLLRKTSISGLLLLFEPQCSNSLQSQHWGTRLIEKYSVTTSLDILVGTFFFSYFAKKDAISWSMEAKDGAKEREPLPSTPPLIGMSILSRPTCQSLLDRCLVGQSRPEAGQTNSRIKTAPLGSQNKTAHRLLV